MPSYNGVHKSIKPAARYRALWTDLGIVGYAQAMELQSSLAKRAGTPGAPGWVLFLEHPPVVTLGRSMRREGSGPALRAPREELISRGIQVVQSDRGGKATLHCPGQLVCYLIMNLGRLRLGVKRYVRCLERVVADSVAEFGIKAGLNPDRPGVWSGGAKLAAVGIRVARGVTTHGFALNLDPDLSMFGLIVPCGMEEGRVTSFRALGVKTPERNKMMRTIARNISAHMEAELDYFHPAGLPARAAKGDLR